MFSRKSKPKLWYTPGGQVLKLYLDMLEQNHIFIAGSQSKDRDMVRDGFIYTALYQSPSTLQFVLLDLVGTYLNGYRDLPHTLAYTHDLNEGAGLLKYVVSLVDNRLGEYRNDWSITFSAVWIVIDGYDLLSLTYKKQVEPLIYSILSKGRIANVHLMLFSSYYKPHSGIDEMFPAYGCLNGTTSAKMYRIMGIKNITSPVGEIIYKGSTTPVSRVKIPYLEESVLKERINWWMNQCRK